jgi:hypothetical protein
MSDGILAVFAILSLSLFVARGLTGPGAAYGCSVRPAVDPTRARFTWAPSAACSRASTARQLGALIPQGPITTRMI